MEKFIDRINKRLVYIQKEATSNFWEEQWDSADIEHEVRSKKIDFLVLPNTRKYLPPGSKILEGGCGIGDYVYSLTKNGFDCIGIDFAEKTINKIKKIVPEVDVRVGDVRKLEFSDNFFDGYWSMGVIEHFFEGYDVILKEMRRVLRPGGYLFLTFPYMSSLRQIKSFLGLYPQIQDRTRPQNFYQFALNYKEVRDIFETNGFRLIHKIPFSGYKGLRDEIAVIECILKPITNYKGSNVFIRGFRFFISVLFSRVSGHCILLVFQKNNQN